MNSKIIPYPALIHRFITICCMLWCSVPAWTQQDILTVKEKDTLFAAYTYAMGKYIPAKNLEQKRNSNLEVQYGLASIKTGIKSKVIRQMKYAVKHRITTLGFYQNGVKYDSLDMDLLSISLQKDAVSRQLQKAVPCDRFVACSILPALIARSGYITRMGDNELLLIIIFNYLDTSNAQQRQADIQYTLDKIKKEHVCR